MTVVISVENLSKQYRLGTISHRTFQRDLQSWWARLRGREDPNLPVDGGRRKKLEQFADENGIIHALKDVSFEVRQGEVLGIIGKNGAGKSTLLKILSRVTAPTSGCVKIKGRIGSLLEVGTGFHPELTGRENIYMNGAILGMKKREIDRKLDEIIDFSGVEQFIDTPVKRYSSGMYVRLAFAVAAHLDPEILVVDEVLAVGDAEFQKKCLGKMDDVSKKEGRTVLFVSHNLDAIAQLCKDSILVEKGKVDVYGPVKEVICEYLKGTKKKTLTPIKERLDRLGRGDARVIDISVFNNDYVATKSVKMGDDFHVLLEIEGKLENAVIGVLIGDGVKIQLIRGYTWESVGDKIDLHAGLNKVKCFFNNFPMMYGEYYISTWISQASTGDIIDYVENVCQLVVERKDIYGIGRAPHNVGGMSFCKTRWHINEDN